MSQPPPDLFEVVRGRTGEMLEEVTRLRREASHALPEFGSPPASYAEAIIELRGILDRLEEIHSDAISLSGGTRRQAAELGAIAQDAWDQASAAPERPRAGREYESGAERAARWNLSTHAQRAAARRASHAAGIAADAEKRIRLAHAGAEGMRQELIPVLRFLQWETTIER
jgi:hypothetical protein